MPLKNSDRSEDNENDVNKGSNTEEGIVEKNTNNAGPKQTERPEEEKEEQIDFSSLSDEEVDHLILEMQAEEMMERQEREGKKTKKRKIRRRKNRKKRPKTGKELAPGFEWVAIKMGVAMTFTFVFIFLGPLFIFMALVKGFGERGVYDIWDLVFGIIGIGLLVGAYYLFKYFTSD